MLPPGPPRTVVLLVLANARAREDQLLARLLALLVPAGDDFLQRRRPLLVAARVESVGRGLRGNGVAGRPASREGGHGGARAPNGRSAGFPEAARGVARADGAVIAH